MHCVNQRKNKVIIIIILRVIHVYSSSAVFISACGVCNTSILKEQMSGGVGRGGERMREMVREVRRVRERVGKMVGFKI